MGFITADMNINGSLERAGLIPDSKSDNKSICIDHKVTNSFSYREPYFSKYFIASRLWTSRCSSWQ